MIRLNQLAVGARGQLTGAPNDGPAPPERLLELGFVAGTEVTVVRRGPLGDPLELELRGYRVCIRAVDLAELWVQVSAEDGYR